MLSTSANLNSAICLSVVPRTQTIRKTRNGKMGRPRGVETITITKMFAVHGHLKRQSVPLKRSVIEKEDGFRLYPYPDAAAL